MPIRVKPLVKLRLSLSVAAAAKAAESGATITLGEGKYTLYGVSSEKHHEGQEFDLCRAGCR